MLIHGAEFNIINSIPVAKKIMQKSLDSLEKIFTVSFFTSRKLEEITATEKSISLTRPFLPKHYKIVICVLF